MKKATFLILVRSTTEGVCVSPVEGYVFSVDNYTFGTTKTGKSWTLYELTTGMKICEVNKRCDTVDQAKSYMDSIDKIFSGIKKGDFLDRANAMIIKGYEAFGISFPYNV